MDREKVLKWVEALESGKYEQWKGTLANEDKTAFCCLGVACEVNGFPYRSRDGALEGKDAKQLGIVGDQRSFIKMNDDLNLSFKDIAAYIRTTVLGENLEDS